MVSHHLARSLIGLVRIVDDTIDDEVLPSVWPSCRMPCTNAP